MNQDLEALRNWKAGEKFDVEFPDFLKPLRNYQKVASVYGLMSKNVVFGDPTGTGKTIEALGLATLLYRKHKIKHCLIVSPFSLGQWDEEIQSFLKWNSVVIRADKRRRKFLWKDSIHCFFTLCNYHTLVSDYETIKTIPFDLVIFDEATAFKNRGTARFQKVQEITNWMLERNKWIVGLSATPMHGKWQDVWGVFTGVGINLGTFEEYVNLFCKTETIQIWNWKNQPRLVVSGRTRMCPSCATVVYYPYIECSSCNLKFKWKKEIEKIVGLKEGKIELLKSVLQDHFIMRTKSDLLPELPKLIIKNIILPFDKEQKKSYNTVSDMEINPLTVLKFQHEVADHPGLQGLKGKSPKLEWISEAMDTQFEGEKIVFFTQYKFMVEKILELSTKRGRNPVKVTGDLSGEEKDDAVYKKFRDDPTCKDLIGTTAIEMSWNLQTAGTIVAVDQIPNPARMAQLYGRIERDGSEHKQITAINLMMEKSVDTAMWDIVEEKVGNVQELFGEKAMQFDIDLMQELIKRTQR